MITDRSPLGKRQRFQVGYQIQVEQPGDPGADLTGGAVRVGLAHQSVWASIAASGKIRRLGWADLVLSAPDG